MFFEEPNYYITSTNLYTKFCSNSKSINFKLSTTLYYNKFKQKLTFFYPKLFWVKKSPFWPTFASIQKESSKPVTWFWVPKTQRKGTDISDFFSFWRYFLSSTFWVTFDKLKISFKTFFPNENRPYNSDVFWTQERKSNFLIQLSHSKRNCKKRKKHKNHQKPKNKDLKKYLSIFLGLGGRVHYQKLWDINYTF